MLDFSDRTRTGISKLIIKPLRLSVKIYSLLVVFVLISKEPIRSGLCILEKKDFRKQMNMYFTFAKILRGEQQQQTSERRLPLSSQLSVLLLLLLVQFNQGVSFLLPCKQICRHEQRASSASE